MDHDGIWGTDVETITMASLLNTTIYCYNVSLRAWVRYQPHNGTDINTPGICLHYVNSKHYCVVKVLSAEFYFYKPITVHLELYLFYCFIHFLLYIGQY